MRRFVVGLVLTCLAVFCGSNQALAQKSSGSRDVNQRIQALRTRLMDFQAQRSASKEEPAEFAELILDSFEIKGEKLVEEFENRSDVAVTVLFHDAEAVVSTAISNESAEKMAENKVEEIAENDDKNDELHLESDSRLKRYEKLRERVCQATRSVRFQASQINRQIARVQ